MAGIGELHRRFHDAAEAAELTLDELWLRYFSLGGLAGRFEVDAYVNGAIAMPPVEHDVLALAINERLDELAPPRAPYSEEFAELGGAPDESGGKW
jgi:hypothetical protein